MRPRNVQRLRIIAAATLIAAALGAASARFDDDLDVVGDAIGGALAGLVLASAEVLMQGPLAGRLRRLALPVATALRLAIYLATYAGIRVTVPPILHLFAPGRASPEESLLSGTNLRVAIGISLIMNGVFLLRALLGPTTLVSLLTGRYHRPRQEQRIVLFIDLKGSTASAERLGDIAFHRLLDRVFSDMSDPVLEAGGEIYRYVGDEIIITWSLARGARDGACIACLFAIDDALARRDAAYVRDFGAVPRLRGALHAGPLIVGEMGDIKREIVMLGDTMNTASRIEGACRSTGNDFIASGNVVQAVERLPEGVRAKGLGAFALRGKESEVQLFALRRVPG